MPHNKIKKLHFCIVYDCLYPYTIGGAERWYRQLIDALLEQGHTITYLTRQQWDNTAKPNIPGVRVISVSQGRELYTQDGRRRLLPPLRFGFGVFRHLLRNRSTYDVIHGCSFPYFALIATRFALIKKRNVKIGVDWFEVWSSNYWKDYLGPLGGTIGKTIQRVCALLTPHAFVFSELHFQRLFSQGVAKTHITRLSGLLGEEQLAPKQQTTQATEGPPTVVFAGRHIPEKQVHLIPQAIAQARKTVPALQAVIFGNGPEQERVASEIRKTNTEKAIQLAGFVPGSDVKEAISHALCLLLPSQREGYGLVVLEAAAMGTPAIVLAGEDNAATELIVPGINGFIAASSDKIADRIIDTYQQNHTLRKTTAQWFQNNKELFDVSTSAKIILECYQKD